jgi:hypothetical protein
MLRVGGDRAGGIGGEQASTGLCTVQLAVHTNERQSQFLRFLVERHLQGRDSELNESVIAVEVLRRDADYDAKLDATVSSPTKRPIEYGVASRR